MSEVAIIRLNPLRSMLHFAHDNAFPTLKKNPDLDGVYIERGALTGVTIAASDDVRLGVWHEPDGYAPPQPVFLPYSRAVIRALDQVISRNENDFAVIDPVGGNLTIVATGEAVEDKIKTQGMAWDRRGL